MAQSFSTILLSAAKTGTPNQAGTSLSGNGVNTIYLATNDVGIAFNPVSPLNNALFSITVEGSTFLIDTAYHLQSFVLLKAPLANNATTYFTALSTGTALLSGNIRVWTAQNRRKHVLGYY